MRDWRDYDTARVLKKPHGLSHNYLTSGFSTVVHHPSATLRSLKVHFGIDKRAYMAMDAHEIVNWRGQYIF